MYIRDDGSKDGSTAVIRSFADKDARFQIVEDSFGNVGYNKSLHKLLSVAQEEYIAFCDHDDIFYPTKLEECLSKIKAIETTQKIPALVHTEAQVVDSHLKPIKPRHIGHHGKKIGLNAIILANCVSGSTMVINSRLKAIILDSFEYIQFELLDYHIAIMVELTGVRAFIDKPLMLYRQHANNAIGTVGTGKSLQASEYTLSLLSGINNYHYFKNEYTKVSTTALNQQWLKEYFYLFEGKNRFKKVWIFIKNNYGFTRKKDRLTFFWLLLKNLDLRQLIAQK